MRYHTLLFDADNTLFDFIKAEEQSFFRTAKEFGISADEKMLSDYKNINEPLWRKLELGEITKDQLVVLRYEKLFKLYNINANARDFNIKYLYNLGFGTQLLPYVKSLIENLSENYKIIIVTNGIADTQKRRIKHSDIAKYIDNIIVSEDAGYSKPYKEFFDYTFKECDIATKKGVLVIGDSLVADIKGANDYGIDSCYFNPHNQHISLDITPTYTINNFSQLLEILEENK